MKSSRPDFIQTTEYTIPAYYASINGQTKFFTLCNIFLESAASHAQRLGFGYQDMKDKNTYWVLSRLHVKMKAYPEMGQRVLVETWPKGMNRLFFLRDYRMYLDCEDQVSSATSAWLIMDGKSGRPSKMDGLGDLPYSSPADLHAIQQVPPRIPGVTQPGIHTICTARYSDLDINRHVNAVKYIEWIQDMYPEEFYEKKNVLEFQINYHSETRFSEEVEILSGDEASKDGFDYFEGSSHKTGKTVFRARIRFGEIQ